MPFFASDWLNRCQGVAMFALFLDLRSPSGKGCGPCATSSSGQPQVAETGQRSALGRMRSLSATLTEPREERFSLERSEQSIG